MSARLSSAAVAALSLALLAACGNASAAEPAESPTPKGQERRYRIQAIVADCMKQKGFKYVPWVAPPREPTEQERKRGSGDYDAMKAFRDKYGYGVWALLVYPLEFGNPSVKPGGNPPVDPNLRIQGSLSDAQRRAYQAAHDACDNQAVKQVTGKDVTSMFDRNDQVNARIAQLKTRELDGDPRLVELAAAMGSCLKAKGYAIRSVTPSALGERGVTTFNAELNRVGRRQRTAPEEARRNENVIVVPDMTADEARPYLTREIKDARDDLECGREFYPVYAPKSAEIEHRAYVEYGLEG
ncbi:hypothetical protein AB0K60_22130 [Thermopolyspora sp. NPDC052614]|uniref:hypothetical protein n=1 Tax=Thermopolyspora sp. NPDC052614 TaxID=3155682 RepID=UPI003441BF7E